MFRSRFAALALSAALLAAAPLDAGLRFTRVSTPSGADVNAFAVTSTALYAGTRRGVFRGDASGFVEDGLSAETIVSLAAFEGTVFAATGQRLYRRTGSGSWQLETLPGTDFYPTVLTPTSDALYVGGFGVLRRQAGAWSVLPSPGGLVSSLLVSGSDLYAGLSFGGLLRLSGSAWVQAGTGLSPSDGVRCLASFSGALYAGTARGLYVSRGAAPFVAETALGSREIRALGVGRGVLRAATSNGVYRLSGSSWLPDLAGLSTFSAKALVEFQGVPVLGTEGGPVASSTNDRWAPLGPIAGQLVSDILVGVRGNPSSGDAAIATRGAGLALLGGTASSPVLPDGCGDVLALAPAPTGSARSLLAATACGPYLGDAVLSAAGSGLPQNTAVTGLSPASTGGVVGSTSGNGLYRFTGSGWSSDSSGLSTSALTGPVREIAGELFAVADGTLTRRSSNGTWTADAATGIPGGSTILSLGGTSTAFAGFVAGGVFRRSTGVFRSDGYGIATASVFGLDTAAGRLVAAGGTTGVLVRREGGFAPENGGLPEGADVRVVRGDAGRKGLWAGTFGQGAYFAPTSPQVKTVPVVLDVVGAGNARYRSELTLGSRAAGVVTVRLRFDAAPGFGAADPPQSGSADVTLSTGQEIRAADALDFLRQRGLAIPVAGPGSPVAGSLSLTAVGPGSSLDGVYALARTYTADSSGGTFGLFYDAVPDVDAPEDEATVYGLRSIASGPRAARSNLAVVFLPALRTSSSLTLEVEVFDGDGRPAPVKLEKTLAPGEWYQWNGVLGLAGLADGATGYARVRRVSGDAPFLAYGIVNDAATADGSFLPAFRSGGLAAARRVVVPVVLDVYGAAGSHFTTELTIVNDSPIATPVDLFYRPAPGFGTAPGVPFVTLMVPARGQRIVPDAVQMLRENGIQVPDPLAAGPQGGSLAAEFRFVRSLDTPRTLVLARTSTPNPDTGVGGSFGLFQSAFARGGGARRRAVVPGLTQNESVRANLAVVHLGGGSDLPLVLRVQLEDAATGAATGSPLEVTLQPGDWYQWSRVLETAGATTGQAVAVITRVSGDDAWGAYGVLNDARTSDGSTLPMIPDDPE
ncbi:MAG: hypothetical protein JNK60_07530 [Acidobacteria bacterium]|nr:hypothetical protein [Acidobacteriota bacterium]